MTSSEPLDHDQVRLARLLRELGMARQVQEETRALNRLVGNLLDDARDRVDRAARAVDDHIEAMTRAALVDAPVRIVG